MNAVLAKGKPMARGYDCEHCHDERVVESAALGLIRCPMCTVRVRVEKDAFARLKAVEEVHRLTAAEARRVKRASERLIALTLSASALKLSRLDSEFVSTNRIMERWSVGEGTGMESRNPDDYRASRPPPLDDRTQEVVNDVLKASRSAIRMFAEDWYASHLPTEVIARGDYWFWRAYRPRRELSSTGVYRELHQVLRYLRFRFERSRHTDLVTLIRSLP